MPKSMPIVGVSIISQSERERIAQEARNSAERHGISQQEWDRWRALQGDRVDILMTYDPAGEARRIGASQC